MASKKSGRSRSKTAPRRGARPKRAARPVRTARPARPAAKREGAKAVRSPLVLNAPNGKPVGTGIGLTHHHMDYSTHDLEGMRRFFVETLGFTNVLHVPEHRYLTVFVTPTSSLGFMPPASSAPEAWQPPGEPNFYFFVADVDAAHATLAARGVTFEQPPTNMPWGHRLAVLRDPEGRRVCLAQNLKR